MIPDINDSDAEEVVQRRKIKILHILSDDDEEENCDLEENDISDKKAINENLSPEDVAGSDSIAAKWKPLRRVRVTMADDNEEEEEEEADADACTKEHLDSNLKSVDTKLNKTGNKSTDLLSGLGDIYKRIGSDSETEENKLIFSQSDKKKNYATTARDSSENLTEKIYHTNERNFDSDNCDSFIKQNNTFESGDNQTEENKTEHHQNKSSKSKKNHHTLKEIKARKDEMLQIRSESQRYLRESAVRLPYHQPQQMTLTEFLERKKRSKMSFQSRPPRPSELIQLEKSEPRDIVRKVLFRDTDVENQSNETTKHSTENNQKIDYDRVEENSIAEVLPHAFEQLQMPNHSKIAITNDPSVKSNCTEKSIEIPLLNVKTEDNVISQTSACLDLSQIKARLKQMYGSYVPHLSGSPNSIIDFSDDQPIKKDVKDFIEKFMKHKEKLQKSSQELKNSKQKNLAFELKIENESTLQAPGAKLALIKEQLKEKMEERKEVIRRKRMEAFKLENEEGFDENDDDNSEAELTDQTDTDEEVITDEDATDSEEEEEFEFGHLRTEKRQKKSIFIDDEAEDDDDADDEIDDDDDDDIDLPPFHLGISSEKNTSINDSGNSRGQLFSWLEGKNKSKDNSIALPTTTTQSGQKEHLDDEECVLHLDLPVESECQEENLLLTLKGSSAHPSFENVNTRNQEDEENLLPTSKNSSSTHPYFEDINTGNQENDGDSPSKSKKVDSFINGDSSFELGKSIIPGYQPGGGLKFGGHAESGSEGEEWFISSTFKSQDIGSIENNKRHDENSMCKTPAVDDLLLKCEESQSLSAIKSDNFLKSEALDAGELSNIITSEKERHNLIPCGLQDVVNNSSLSQKTDVMALCSGTFDSINHSTLQLKLESTQAEDSVQMNELLDLCSGKFNESQSQAAEQDYHSDTSVEIGHKKTQKKSHLVLDDSDSDLDRKLYLSDSQEELESDEFHQKEESIMTSFKGFRCIDGIRKEFVEDEAELSGSGVSEDENEDDDDDELEEEIIAFSDVDISDEELKNQIERVHNKAVLDEEKRKLLLLQERYLMDGDLHSDGQGRQRKFRWRNIDENMALDNDNISSEEEEKENEIQEWRIQRFEREKWLHEQEENGKSSLISPKKDPVHQIVNKSNRTGRFFHRNSSVKESLGKLSIKNHSSSFLAKGDAFLDRLAMNIKKEDEGVGRRCTKNIIFKASSPEKVTKKRQNNSTQPLQNVLQSKKPKLINYNSESSQNQRRSIFDCFDTK